METPNVTPVQYGAGGVFLAVAAGCLNTSITGSDLVAYLASSALVTAALVLADAIIRNGRAGAVASEMQGVQSTLAAFDRGTTTQEADA
jgi:hypothetical protein